MVEGGGRVMESWGTVSREGWVGAGPAEASPCLRYGGHTDTQTSFPADTGEPEECPCSSGMPVAPPTCPPAFLLRMQGLLSLAQFLDTRSLAQGKEGAITAVPSTLTHTQILGFSLPLPSGQHPWAP